MAATIAKQFPGAGRICSFSLTLYRFKLLKVHVKTVVVREKQCSA